MHKNKLTDIDGNFVYQKVPEVVDARPAGGLVMVELLTPQEILGTSLHVGENTVAGAPQGYILELGPRLEGGWGFKKGDRVVLSGNFTPLPEVERSHRPIAILDPNCIKAVLVEE